MSADVDVALVGGGPVGMLLAGELAIHGVRTTVLERRAQPTGESKAGTLHARTAQSLDRRGLFEAVQPNGNGSRRRSASTPFHFAAMFGLDLAEVVDEGPALLGSPQAYAEDVFARRAAENGAQIERGSEVVHLEDHGDAVTLDVAGIDGNIRTVRARWVVGCDGARSVVRDKAGIGFIGTQPTVGALMGEVKLLKPQSVPSGWQRTRRGWTLIWTNPVGHSRVGTYDFRGPYPDGLGPPSFEEFRDEVERIAGQPVPMSEPRALTRFSDAALQADHYRKGRVFVAGDAAHVHFPLGGQGLNLGLQDAINLGWKLSAEVNGRAPDELLDTYHSERHPVGQRVLYNVRAQVALMKTDVLTDSLRDLFGELMRLPQVNQLLSGMISGTAVQYETGPSGDQYSGKFAPNLSLKTNNGMTTLADLLHKARPVLLDFGANAKLFESADSWRDRIDFVYAVPQPEVNVTALLVRPDGYIAWSANGADSDIERLKTTLRYWFGHPKNSN